MSLSPSLYLSLSLCQYISFTITVISNVSFAATGYFCVNITVTATTTIAIIATVAFVVASSVILVVTVMLQDTHGCDKYKFIRHSSRLRQSNS